MTASQLAEALSAKEQDGTAYIRLKMENGKDTIQVQIKSRGGPKSSAIVYQVLWPKERKGEGVLLHKSGHSFSGATFTPPNTLRTLDSAQLRDPLLGSALSLEDVVDSFFSWDQQTLDGTETVNGVNCQILESKPGKSGGSYGVVRSWIDVRRLVPLRVEKYSSPGHLVRRIDTTRVAQDDKGHPITANLTVHDMRSGAETQLDGSRIRHDVSFSDAEFTPEGLKTVTGPKGSGE